MKWKNRIASHPVWSGKISNRQEKERVAEQVSQCVKDGDVIGVGSGSTSYLALEKIAQRVREEQLSLIAIPTSIEADMNCSYFNIQTTSLLSARPDWSFDGADEVDDKRRLIKGRGGALFTEKLVMVSSPKTYILVDESKLVRHLGEKFNVPVEVDPRAVHLVEESLKGLPVKNVRLRMAQAKDGPVITEDGNVILDVGFFNIDDHMENELNKIPGVIETGLFIGYSVEILTV